MFVDIKTDDFQDIIDLFTEDEGMQGECWVDMGRIFIRGEENELMLRLSKFTNTVTIARVVFKNRRKGYGSRLLKLLTEYVKANGYQKIMIESMSTEDILAFAKKKGFVKANDGSNEYPGYYGNWELHL